MGEFIVDRNDALEILNRYVKEKSLLKHSFSVEAAMRHFAEYFDEDIEKWGIIGLLHDLDYEMYPDEHCVKVVELLEAEKYPDEYIKAITSHGYGLREGVDNPPQHIMEKVLYGVDEMTGLINACVLVRPSKSIYDLNVKSVNKKWKDKAFAARIKRDVIENGIDMLGMEKNDFINETIEAMKKYAKELDLEGNLQT